MNLYQSWGRYPRAEHSVKRIGWLSDDILPATDLPLLAYGQGRSYGDCCLNDKGMLLDTAALNRLIAFDEEQGLLRCEAGVTLEDILHFAVPKGWFLSVTPGTKYVSIGGAIANDVHGKNHHRAGTFGCHVKRFELLRSNSERLVCSLDENKELFIATIGGLGLTGLILWAEIQLRKVAGPYIDMESIKFSNLEEFFEISGDSDQGFDYTVAWLDCVAKGEGFGRGIFMRGNHSEKVVQKQRGNLLGGLLTVPIDAPAFALNNLTVRAFNTVYYNKQRQKEVRSTVDYNPFFYPLDAVSNWNRIYGSRGFMQFQCVVPSGGDNQPIRTILKAIVDSGRASFLAVLKEFGDAKSPGLMSFPNKGVTLCLDFPNQGEATFKLFKLLEDVTRESGGRMYPAKDACMSRESFNAFYPHWRQFKEYQDPAFSSSFWRRVTGEGGKDE
ncbi:FAD-binding oxidoreductase [Oligoflexia bacterium]|nr:FAD-binding oxidoreductase [Oligoflexia bacterium]